MANPRYAGYAHSGVSYKHAASLTGTYAAFATTADPVNARFAGETLPFVRLENVNIELASIAGGATSVTFYLARDVSGDYPISPAYTTNIVPGLTTAAVGAAVQGIGLDYHYEARTGETIGTVYVVAKLNAGTATGAIWVNWKA